MKVLGVIYLIWIIYFTLFGELEISKQKDNNIIHRFVASLLVGVILTVVFGLPLLGILYLLGL